MKGRIIQFLTAVIGLGISFGLSATDTTIWIDCESDMNNNAMFMEYIGTEDYCYRVKVRCDVGLYGAFLVDVFVDDGGVGFFGDVNNGVPPEEGGAFCGFGFGHLRNTGFTHSCDFDIGKAELDVKAVHGTKCGVD